MAQQGLLELHKLTKVLVADIKAKDSKLHQILDDIVNAPGRGGGTVADPLILADDQKPPHYWAVSVEIIKEDPGKGSPTLVLNDLGTKKPTK